LKNRLLELYDDWCSSEHTFVSAFSPVHNNIRIKIEVRAMRTYDSGQQGYEIVRKLLKGILIE
jgi:hypothetical protein